MKLWILTTLSTVSLLIFSGCGASPEPKKELKVDLTLPVVTLTQNGVFADINAIAFEWKSLNNSDVTSIDIYKQSKYYETIDNRFATHYVDNNIRPNTLYSYAFKTVSKESESKLSQVVKVKSLDFLDSVTWIHSITGMPRSAKIIWRPHSNTKVKSYIIERRTLLEKEYQTIAKIDGRLNAEFIDKELEDNYKYRYRVRVETFDKIISKPSLSVDVITRELPSKIININATKTLAKKIDLKWNRSDSKQFHQYYIYKAQSVDGNYKLIATLYNNYYTDNVEEDGKKFFYRVSAVDVDGLESVYDKNTIVGMTISKPKTPKIVVSRFFDNKIEIKWNNIDSRTKKYRVVKIEKEGWFDKTEKIFDDITGTTFIDKNIKVGNSYFYKIAAFDKDSVVSKYSEEVEVKVLAEKPVEKMVVVPVEDMGVISESMMPDENLKLDEK
ncbi:MAG: hypothetical protein U9P38_06060 [Campylobacterota bacterium]|nr:hypothetical protein [Campylobacterota bacterium]